MSESSLLVYSIITAIACEEKRAGCFAFVFLYMSCYRVCAVAPPGGAVGGLRCVIVVFLDHIYILVVRIL